MKKGLIKKTAKAFLAGKCCKYPLKAEVAVYTTDGDWEVRYYIVLPEKVRREVCRLAEKAWGLLPNCKPDLLATYNLSSGWWCNRYCPYILLDDEKDRLLRDAL